MKKLFGNIKRESKNIIINSIFAILNLLFVSFFYRNIILTSALILLLTICFIFYYKSTILVPVFVFGMFGALAEMFAIGFGVWTYSIVSIVNIPLWLFFLWGNAAMFIYRTAVELERLGFHK